MSVDLGSERRLEAEMHDVRRLLSRFLVGSGVELGPGHHPFPVAFGATQVRYVDRWEPEENQALFPELGDQAAFPRPDVISNLDVDRLKPLDDQSQDFVIASHVLEHMADPIGLLDEIHRVLRPGGTALILLPDRRRTFDARRPATTLEHLVGEYDAQVTEVADDHILEFIELNGIDDWDAYQRLSPAEQAEYLENHRRRSIHVHCWQEDEFAEVLLHAVGHLGHDWELLDGVLPEDEGPYGFEFGYVLRRGLVEMAPEVRRLRFADTWELWRARRRRPTPAVTATPVDPVVAAPAAGAKAPSPVEAPAPAPRPLHRRVGGRVKRAILVLLGQA